MHLLNKEVQKRHFQHYLRGSLKINISDVLILSHFGQISNKDLGHRDETKLKQIYAGAHKARIRLKYPKMIVLLHSGKVTDTMMRKITLLRISIQAVCKFETRALELRKNLLL